MAQVVARTDTNDTDEDVEKQIQHLLHLNVILQFLVLNGECICSCFKDFGNLVLDTTKNCEVVQLSNQQNSGNRKGEGLQLIESEVIVHGLGCGFDGSKIVSCIQSKEHSESRLYLYSAVPKKCNRLAGFRNP